MKLKNRITGLLFLSALLIGMTSSCFRTKYPINYEFGLIPDTVYNLESVNTIYDDYNSTSTSRIDLQFPLIFSTNRFTKGEKFDLVSYDLFISFDQTEGTFLLQSSRDSYPYIFLTDLANTDANEFGPLNGQYGTDDYLFCFSSDRTGNMEIYTSFWNSYTFTGSPMNPAPFRLQGVNSPEYDAYPSFTRDFSKMVFCSNRDGNLDFYSVDVPEADDIPTWIKLVDTTFVATPIIELNSPAEDVCPFVNGSLIVFTSKREGGFGGYDLWYARVELDGFSEPVNFGSRINTEYDEFRPIVMYAPRFENDLLIFSSNRPGGAGGFDLYYTGIERMTLQDQPE